MRGPVSNSEIIGKFTQCTTFIKMPASFNFLKIRLLSYFDRLTSTILSK